MKHEKRCTLVDAETGRTVCGHVTVANTFVTRLVGLLGRRSLRPEHGLLLQPSSGIHTLGMRFAIDAVAMDRDGVVLRTAERLRPWRILTVPRRTASVLELPAGHLHQHRICVGCRIVAKPTLAQS